VTSLPLDPFTGTARLLIDGSNLLGLMARQQTSTPPATLIGRLRAVAPASVAIEVVFDGPPDPGLRGNKVAPGVSVRHSGRRSADALLIDLVDQERMRSGPSGAATLLVVTDDNDLRRALRAAGARVAGASWLLSRMERQSRPAGSSVGNRKPPRPPGGSGPPSGPGASGGSGASGSAVGDDSDGEPERTPWKPGRGATVKRGNPHRGHPSSGRMPR
jgi:YacP-like NYN domain